mmetsp:Transcript_42917/g.123096  ORF Transcript_42917/g.123096 Transcript_42917/m.123096 type:complete len:282 (+) Transcript_42917:375-1220(+)
MPSKVAFSLALLSRWRWRSCSRSRLMAASLGTSLQARASSHSASRNSSSSIRALALRYMAFGFCGSRSRASSQHSRALCASAGSAFKQHNARFSSTGVRRAPARARRLSSPSPSLRRSRSSRACSYLCRAVEMDCALNSTLPSSRSLSACSSRAAAPAAPAARPRAFAPSAAAGQDHLSQQHVFLPAVVQAHADRRPVGPLLVELDHSAWHPLTVDVRLDPASPVAELVYYAFVRLHPLPVLPQGGEPLLDGALGDHGEAGQDGVVVPVLAEQRLHELPDR